MMCMRTPAFLIMFMLFSCRIYAQRSMKELRDLVDQADSLSTRSQATFYLFKIGPKNTSRKETWYYTLQHNKPVMFQVRYYQDSTEVTEVYYVEDGRLICSEEYETVYHNADDEIGWGKIYYFDNSIVRQVVTMGKSRFKGLNAERTYEALSRFSKRFGELKENLIATNTSQ